ncbi:MAG: universal stress protein [Solirubrobacteraceae bacterium]
MPTRTRVDAHNLTATAVGERTIDGPQLVRRRGVPADDIVAVAGETASDLIVLAWPQSLGEGHAHVVSETLAHASIPVLLLPVASRRRRRSGPTQ